MLTLNRAALPQLFWNIDEELRLYLAESGIHLFLTNNATSQMPLHTLKIRRENEENVGIKSIVELERKGKVRREESAIGGEGRGMYGP